MLQEEVFHGFSSENKIIIKNQLFAKIDFIKELNAREENGFKFPTGEIHEMSKVTPLTLRNIVEAFIIKTKNIFWER